MSDIPDLPDAAPQTSELLGLLTHRAWRVFEGAATAAEFLTLVSVDPTMTLKTYRKRLTPDYQEAWLPFETLIAPFVQAKASDNWPLLITGLVHAVSECILDTIFYVEGAKAVDFRSWLVIARDRGHYTKRQKSYAKEIGSIV